MPWYFRKSKTFGPFRLNLSKSGLGFSFGFKGARISASSRGTFVSVGTGGIYYRTRVGGRARRDAGPSTSSLLEATPAPDLDQFTDADSKDLINELERKAKRKSIVFPLGFAPSIFLLSILVVFLYPKAEKVISNRAASNAYFVVKDKAVNIRESPSRRSKAIADASPGEKIPLRALDSAGWTKVYVAQIGRTGYIFSSLGVVEQAVITHASTTSGVAPVLPPALREISIALVTMICIAWCVWLTRLDKRRRTMKIAYSLEGNMAGLHQEFLDCFKDIRLSSKIWESSDETRVSDPKYHSGASQTVSRNHISSISISDKSVHFIQTNVSVPVIVLRNARMFFFPERLILQQGTEFAGIFYRNLEVTLGETRFIETEAVPDDAEVVDHTWEYPNSSGGPDKRFNRNRQLPICRYSEYKFSTETGFRVTLITSKLGAMDRFGDFLRTIGKYQEELQTQRQ